MDASALATIIVGAFTLISTITLGLLQRKLWKSQATKTDVESYTTLVKAITEKTETDFNIMSQLNAKLNETVSELRERVRVLEGEKLDLENRLNSCECELNKMKTKGVKDA